MIHFVSLSCLLVVGDNKIFKNVASQDCHKTFSSLIICSALHMNIIFQYFHCIMLESLTCRHYTTVLIFLRHEISYHQDNLMAMCF